MKFLTFIFLGLFVANGAFAAASCPNGYGVAPHTTASTFTAPVDGVCPFAGYAIMELPTELFPIYNGFTAGNTISQCNGVYANGSCTGSYSQGLCESDSYATGAAASTYSAPVNGICTFSGYSLVELPSELYPIYNGFLAGNTIPWCANGRRNSSACITYTPSDGTGNCAVGYYDYQANANTFADLTNGACSSPYSKFTGTTRCDHNPGETCVDIPTPVVSLTWDDGFGNTTSGSCVYEDLITLPATPVARPGYVFKGWKLQTQQ